VRSEAVAAVKCKHEWKRVPAHVVTVLDEPEAKQRCETYNAECAKCGAHAWLHWPVSYGRE